MFEQNDQSDRNSPGEKMNLQNSAVIADSQMFSERKIKRTDQKQAQVRQVWMRGAILGLTAGVLLMVFGLLVFAFGSFNGFSGAGVIWKTVATWMLIVSLPACYAGAHCLDKAFEPFYKKSRS